MATQISSLSVVLGATLGPFASGFAAGEHIMSGFRSAVGSTLGTVAKLSGAMALAEVTANAIRSVIASPGAAIEAAGRQADAETRLAAVLRATGGAAGYSVDALKEHAAALQATTTFGDEAILEFQAVLATFRNVSGPVFQEATGLALDMASVMGTDLQSAGVQLGKALNDPMEGISALTRVGVSFTEQQKSQIKTMQQAGDVAGAQGIILKELQGEFGGAAEAMAKTPFGRIKQFGNTIGDMAEQVGNSLAAITVGIANAINLNGIFSKVSAGLAAVQSAVESAVANYGPIISDAIGYVVSVTAAGFGMVYNTVANVLGAVWGFVQPTIAAIVAVFADNWRGMVTTAAGYFLSIYNVIDAALSAAWQIVTTAATGVATVWAWAMGGLGVTTTGAVSGVLSGIQTFYSYVTTAFNVVAYVVRNFQDVIAGAMLAAAYDVVKFGGEVTYLFTDVVPGLLSWFGRNWPQVFTDAGNATLAVFTNLATNAAMVGKAIWAALTGGDIALDWTPLTSGFKSSIEELPQIAARQVGETEAVLRDASAAMNGQLSKGLAEYLAEQDAKTKAAGSNIADNLSAGLAGLFSGLGGLGMSSMAGDVGEFFDPKTYTAGKMEIDTKPADEAIKATKEKAAKPIQTELLVSGSAESLATQAAAAFNASIFTPGAGSTDALATTATAASGKPGGVAGGKDSPATGSDAAAGGISQLVVLFTQAKAALDKVVTNTGKAGSGVTIGKAKMA